MSAAVGETKNNISHKCTMYISTICVCDLTVAVNLFQKVTRFFPQFNLSTFIYNRSGKNILMMED